MDKEEKTMEEIAAFSLVSLWWPECERCLKTNNDPAAPFLP
jgi:hypothetical protein